MIKYITYDSIDDNGHNIVPVNSLYQMNKTAASNYAPEIMKVILHMQRKPDRYYVVINALGSYEMWGSNRNGDAFPESGLVHKSLRTDMGTPNDYGYKTFEYYAKFYKHHVNKDPKRSFGEIIFSHWNPVLHRVELIAAIDTIKGSDIVEALEKGLPIAVSMGCKVKFDRCSICDNNAPTRRSYCKHLKNYMGKIVTPELAALWSKELGKVILPGAVVFAWNDFPRFFDLSKVYVGADRISYILGKAASAGPVILSVDLADAYGVTDLMVDKFAQVNKKSEIDKDVGGTLGPDDIDGRIQPANKVTVFRKALDEKVNASIAAEPKLPKQLMDSMASVLPLSTIFSTLLGLGIHPKPDEFQRIVLVKINKKPLADELDNKGIIFNYRDKAEPQHLDVSNNNFSNTLGRLLTPHLQSRSCFPSFLEPRMKVIMVKTGQLESPPKEYTPIPEHALIGLAALYTGLKLKAQGYGPKQLAEIFKKPWLQAIIGGGAVSKIYQKIDESKDEELLRPAIDYENILQDTNFSGHMKQGSVKSTEALGRGLIAGALTLPAAYVSNVYNQKALRTKGRKLFPGAGTSPRLAATGIGISTAGISGLLGKLKK